MKNEARQDDILVSYALYTLWLNAKDGNRITIQGIIAAFLTRNPLMKGAFDEALIVRQELHKLRAFFQEEFVGQNPGKVAPQVRINPEVAEGQVAFTLRSPIAGHNLYRITVMETQTLWSEAVALITVWQYGDGGLRRDIEEYIRSRIRTQPAFVHQLQRATATIEKMHRDHTAPIFKIAILPNDKSRLEYNHEPPS
jgi:hypothetical protein